MNTIKVIKKNFKKIYDDYAVGGSQNTYAVKFTIWEGLLPANFTTTNKGLQGFSFNGYQSLATTLYFIADIFSYSLVTCELSHMLTFIARERLNCFTSLEVHGWNGFEFNFKQRSIVWLIKCFLLSAVLSRQSLALLRKCPVLHPSVIFPISW